MDWASSADLHKLRIRIKKLRYSSELLSSLFKSKDARKFLSKLTKMQDMLGTLNDAATAVHLAGQINPDVEKLENAEIIAYLKGYAHAQSHFSITAFESAWKKFKTSKIFW
jgi:CHAD domain-containing protein